VLRGEDGPTAIQTRLGWVLSGPTNGAVQNDQQQNNFVTTHVPKTATTYELFLKCKLRLAEGGFNLRKFMSNSSQLTERIQQNEARISVPAISANTDHMRSPSDLSKEDSVIEEDKTYAKSVLGTAEETSGAEQKVFGVRWNFVSDQFVPDLREIATLARNIKPTKRNVVSQQISMIQWDVCHPSRQSSRCSFKNFLRQRSAGTNL